MRATLEPANVSGAGLTVAAEGLDSAATGSSFSPELVAELLNPASWASPLERFGRTTNVAVALTDRQGSLLGDCQNPQPIWLSVRRASGLDQTGCPFCTGDVEPCRCVVEALRTGKITAAKDRIGLAHVAAPVILDGEPLGALLAGQVFVDFPQLLPLQRLERELNISSQALWPLAIQHPPLRMSTLQTYGELLESLGQAFVRELYAETLSRRLQHALEEKTLLLQEVHHRVKNNMAVITSLLGMQAASSTEEVAAHLLESQRRVFSIAAIHDHLYRSESLKQIRFDEYVKELAEDLCAVHGYPARIRVHIAFENIQLGIDQALPCGLILNELLTNAFKYAFPDGRSGEIVVNLAPRQPAVFVLSVKDNGVGLPADFDWRDPQSLGLRIVRVLAKQISGTLEVRCVEGAQFSVTFPFGEVLPSNGGGNVSIRGNK